MNFMELLLVQCQGCKWPETVPSMCDKCKCGEHVFVTKVTVTLSEFISWGVGLQPHHHTHHNFYTMSPWQQQPVSNENHTPAGVARSSSDRDSAISRSHDAKMSGSAAWCTVLYKTNICLHIHAMITKYPYISHHSLVHQHMADTYPYITHHSLVHHHMTDTYLCIHPS